MANKAITYKGYTGSCEVSTEDECLIGRIQFIDDIIVYEGNTFAELKDAFQAAVDRYMAYCAETGQPAEKPCSGTFNVRVGKELHRLAAKSAAAQGMNLNEFMIAAIQAAVSPDSRPRKIEHNHLHRHVIELSSVTLRSTPEKPHTWNAPHATH